MKTVFGFLRKHHYSIKPFPGLRPGRYGSKKSWPVFCFFVIGGISLLLCCSALNRKRNGGLDFLRPAATAAVPADFTRQLFPERPLLKKTLYLRILAFQNYMDSLRRTPAGLRIYDSLLMRSPQLMDSTAQVIEYYQPLPKR